MNANYYAVIPGNVRYDKTLTPNAKLLYGEITALCNERGYCWATNSYFSELYSVSKTSISKWINQLVKKGYISSEVKYKESSKEIEGRYLRIVQYPIEEKFNTPIEEKFKDNTTSFNNTKDSIYTIFDFWNEQGIINHRKLNATMKRHINARVTEDGYSVEELQEAITNYKQILESDDYYWTHKWTLQEFMKPNNAIKFLSNSNPFDNYRDKFNKKQTSSTNRKVARDF